MSDIDKLKKMRSQVEDAKISLHRLEGQAQSLDERLEKDLGLKSEEEVNQELQKIGIEKPKLETQLSEGIKAIEEKYEFEEER